MSISRWDVHIVGFGQCVGRWVWCAYVSSGLESVGWGCAFCVAMMGQEGVHVCGERHFVGGIRSIGSFVGEGARVGPVGRCK